MIWLITLLILIIFLCWLLIAPVIMEIDTRVPHAGLRWVSIGNVKIWYDEEWWISIEIFFFRKTIRFSNMKSKSRKAVKTKVKKKQKGKTISNLVKIIRVIKTFRVTEWHLAVDTNDSILNAQLYPLNYWRGIYGHLHINFNEENFLFVRIRNRPWKILYAFIR